MVAVPPPDVVITGLVAVLCDCNKMRGVSVSRPTMV